MRILEAKYFKFLLNKDPKTEDVAFVSEHINATLEESCEIVKRHRPDWSPNM